MVPVIAKVAVELLSDDTTWPNLSTRAMYRVSIDPPLCWLVIDRLVEPEAVVKCLLKETDQYVKVLILILTLIF